MYHVFNKLGSQRERAAYYLRLARDALDLAGVCRACGDRPSAQRLVWEARSKMRSARMAWQVRPA